MIKKIGSLSLLLLFTWVAQTMAWSATATVPQVVITSPSRALPISGAVTVQASVTSNRAIKSLSMIVTKSGGGSQSIPNNFKSLQKNFTVSGTWTPSSDGSYTIQIVATDTLNRSGSASISVNVKIPSLPTPPSDSTPPTGTTKTP
jgi:hypothetical protein